jgi:hypothetical protein
VAIVARCKRDAGEGDAAFLRAKMGTAQLLADDSLTRAPGLRTSIVEDSAGMLALDEAIPGLSGQLWHLLNLVKSHG